MSQLPRLLTGLIAAIALTPAALAADDHETATSARTLAVEYTGSVLFLQVANISLSTRLEPETYSAAATFKSAGLLRWFDDTDIEATSVGYRTEAGLEPYRYEHVNHSSNKGRVVGINFENGRAIPDVQPPFGSMGNPPASDEERQGALDPIAVILSLMLEPQSSEELCTGRQNLFDGKARYDLRLVNLGPDDVRTRAYRGEATRCHAFIEPISGYDDGDRPSDEEIARPVNLWFIESDGVQVPVRFRAATQLGNISIEARRIYNGAAE